jgi:hypothetical protein
MPCAKARGHSIDDNTYHDCGNIAVRGALAIHPIHNRFSYPDYYMISDCCLG